MQIKNNPPLGQANVNLDAFIRLWAKTILNNANPKRLGIVSLHNLVLAQLLALCLGAFSMGRDANAGLALARGLLAQTNGLNPARPVKGRRTGGAG